MQLSHIFEVSVDYLLKSGSEEKISSSKGFYVSREMAFGYFANTKAVNKFIGIGFALCLLSGIPYSMFAEQNSWRILGMAVCII